MSWTRGLVPELRPWAEYLKNLFPELQVTSVRRSRSEQLRLWHNRHHNKYPVAPPGSSKHEYGLAWDMVGPRGSLYRAGAIWRAWGGFWSPQDEIHFEVR